MSTQFSVPHPDPAAASPGMALVQRIDGPVPTGSGSWVRVLFRLCLYALPALLGIVPASAMQIGGTQSASFLAHPQLVAVFSFAWIAALELFQAGSYEGINTEHSGMTAVLKSVCAASIASVMLLELLGLPLPSVAFILIGGAILLVTSVTLKLSFRAVFEARRPTTRIMVAVAHVRNGSISWSLVRKEASLHKISGAIRLHDLEGSWPLVGAFSSEELVREIRRVPVEGVLISAPANEVSRLSQRIKAFGGLGAPARIVIGQGEGPSLHDRISSVGCLYLLNAAAMPAKTVNYRVLKRAFDIVFSFAALVVGSPLFLLIALAVRMSSKGGVFFVQDRVGWNGRVFRMYKFRTMRELPATESDARWTTPEDPRRTAVGRFLRKYSLDELPQFFNVLKGDMSVVGPRPERPFFVSNFRRHIDEYHRRHQLKTGITGWAQVNGLRGDTCIRTRLMYDLYYLQNWGLIFDLKIVLRTVLCIFRGRNAY